MNMITFIFVIVIIVLLFLIVSQYISKKSNTDIEKMDTSYDDDNIDKDLPKVEPNFIEAQFHQDYLDVITSFNNIATTNRQIFNINNVPCKVYHNVDVSDVGKIVEEFIDELNNDIAKNVPYTHNVNSGWDEQLPEKTVESGWEKIQRSLGLPPSLFNKPVMKTRVNLVQFSHITKYETESEIKYKCHVIISKNKVHDQLVVQCSFVLPKGMTNTTSHVIIESIYVLGFLTTQGLGVDRVPMDNLYYFDSLEQNNIITGKTVAQELTNKFKLRQKLMQERVDNMDLDTQEKYRETPSIASYDSYQVTQTIFDDMFADKKFY